MSVHRALRRAGLVEAAPDGNRTPQKLVGTPVTEHELGLVGPTGVTVVRPLE